MKNAIRIAIFVIISAALIVGYYFYLSHGRTKKDPSPAEQSELEKVLTVDFNTKYPQTPREVMKWYNRIIKLYHAPDISETQLEMLCDQARMLMDARLQEMNPRDSYISSVMSEVKEYSARGKKMLKADVCGTDDVDYKKKDGEQLAYVLVNYVISEGSNYQTTYQKFVLCKDENDCWKILGSELSDEDGL